MVKKRKINKTVTTKELLPASSAATAAFAYEFQQLQQLLCYFCDFSEPRDGLWNTHAYSTSHTFTQSHIRVLRSCISFGLAFELWLSSAVTWLIRVLVINILLCLHYSQDFSSRFANSPQNFALDSCLSFEKAKESSAYDMNTNELKIDSSRILNYYE